MWAAYATCPACAAAAVTIAEPQVHGVPHDYNAVSFHDVSAVILNGKTGERRFI